ncbi:MAG TPA: serine/threonine-protein kinase [Longimicrobiales bacterium]|nr:serine/threonine-protein kinase [Longimicrobiales bacterium]
MSTADDPKKQPPKSTMAWTPEDLEAAAAKVAGGAQPTEAQPPEAPEEDPLIGQLLRNKWRVLKRIGAGGFGTVYKVRDEKGGWIEALKILSVDRITGSEVETARKRFLREAQIMKRLGTESQHIVGLSTYEEDLEAGLIYFLMEFVEGKSLADTVLADGPLPLERTLRLALQACEALIVAHEGPDGVVHRDLKLENFMLTKDRAGQETLKVLDFGIAKLTEKEADSRLTTVGTLGTPGYAAPEQLRAEPVDARTDLFAFGVVLYGLLTARDPWLGNRAGESTTEIYQLMLATDRCEVIPMSETGVSVPPAMESIVMKLLRREPDQRYQSAKDLKEALLRVQAGGLDAALGSLRVMTEPKGVRVEIRHGRRTVTEGPTPCVANALAAGSYRVVLKDERFEPAETVVALDAGAMEDITLSITPRATGVAAGVRRRPGVMVGAGVAVLALAAVGILQPWGRTLDVQGLKDKSASGGIASARLAPDGVRGRLRLGPVPAPFKVPLPEAEMAATVAELRSAGVELDTSWEVARLVGLAQEAQAAGRYFGRDGEDVQSHAQRLAALEPGNPEARSLLLKVAERMAWDADAALQDGEADRARQLREACLALVPAHPRCAAAGGGS